ncbi:IS1634 family transposase [Leptospirillum ferriphilum]|uniref:Transposase n=1 Tax=Leptospirillum ferriphilum (strain ML-04) TaxID=1048260 RepID=J9Z7P1_LEPFM|nr:IS1634 family transposase [Leptospirillum ferriphilum]AFS52560.1 transposase [Leptospirillum ferriphilum ML-04]
MNKSRSAVHLVRIKKTHGQKVYTSVLLRHSIREGKNVRSETLANLSCLPEETVNLIELSLKGVPLGRLDQDLACVRSLPHGHVAAVVGTMRASGLSALLGARRTRERDLQEALIAHRLVSPGSKLSLSRALSPETATSTLGEVLGVAGATEDELYEAMDALLARQTKIETALAQKHLQDGTLVLYDVSSSYYTGEHCDLARYGHNRDGKKRFPQIVYGLLCASDGCPVAVEVFEGNTADPNTLATQVQKLRERFGLQRIVLVTDRGILTQVQIDKVREIPGFDWITALRSPLIAKLRDQGAIQASLFDTKHLAEITSPDYPGERLIVCRNPVLADRRAWKREELLAATEKNLQRVVEAVQRPKNPLRGKDKIALRVGKMIDKHHVGKHFDLTFEDDSFSFRRNEGKIREEAALDGLYVIRTSLEKEILGAEKTVGAYKALSQVERAFRSLKTVDLEIRPIYHRLSDRVKSHVFLCMLAYYVEWTMKQKLAPLLFAEEDREGAEQEREDIVSPAMPSKATRKKAGSHRTEEGLPVQTFGGLLEDLGTLVKNVMQAGKDETARFTMLTASTPLQQKALELLGAGPNL